MPVTQNPNIPLVPACVTMLRHVLHHDYTLRHNLSHDPTIYYDLIRGQCELLRPAEQKLFWCILLTLICLVVSLSGHPCPCQNCSQRPSAEKTGRGSLLNLLSCPHPPPTPVGRGTEILHSCLLRCVSGLGSCPLFSSSSVRISASCLKSS